jgi:hypothetical protein
MFHMIVIVNIHILFSCAASIIWRSKLGGFLLCLIKRGFPGDLMLFFVDNALEILPERHSYAL